MRLHRTVVVRRTYGTKPQVRHILHLALLMYLNAVTADASIDSLLPENASSKAVLERKRVCVIICTGNGALSHESLLILLPSYFLAPSHILGYYVIWFSVQVSSCRCRKACPSPPVLRVGSSSQ